MELQPKGCVLSILHDRYCVKHDSSCILTLSLSQSILIYFILNFVFLHFQILFHPIRIGQLWAIVNFSARCDLSYLSRELINCGRNKGIVGNIFLFYSLGDPQVVGSRHWPLISRYRASVRTQSPKLETIDSLYKPGADGQDHGMIR
ncbi:hypothetical protein B296_00024543 [Ensete ventricosum]|uniref:Uncharacterized protein n=1 Tax=Ensete ventricosum TaxID=4639 RepID=A0A427AS98_ENSVE|nr:hypothetical protein B296_00024543 [Ensete ventricosum]